MVRFVAAVVWGCVAAGLVAAAADGPPPEESPRAEGPRTPDEVLRAKDLQRVGAVYVLPGEMEAAHLYDDLTTFQDQLVGFARQRSALAMPVAQGDARIVELNQQIRALNALAGVGGKDSLPDRLAQANRDVMVDDIRRQIDAIRVKVAPIQLQVNNLDARIASGRAELQRRVQAFTRLRDETLGRYRALADDPEVKAALAVLNKTSQPKVALGPMDRYRLNVAQSALEVLQAKGLVREKDSNRFVAAAEVEVNRHATQARLQLHQLEELLEPRPGPGRAAGGPTFGRVAAKRQEFVQEVLALRAAAAEAQAQGRALAVDPEVNDALEELNKSRSTRQKLRIGSTSDYARSLRDLMEFETRIHFERIPLEPDKLVAWVEVTLDGADRVLMVHAPEVEAVVLSAPFAAEHGIRPEPSGPTQSLTLDDGRTVPARRLALRSVRVGPMEVQGVECLILPEGCGDPPPLLGASFLDHFAHLVDPQSDTLTLARVTPRTTPD
ncbi:MAG TPA: retropepsin-like aspartic protease [Isosphaeraceae bacterium]